MAGVFCPRCCRVCCTCDGSPVSTVLRMSLDDCDSLRVSFLLTSTDCAVWKGSFVSSCGQTICVEVRGCPSRDFTPPPPPICPCSLLMYCQISGDCGNYPMTLPLETCSSLVCSPLDVHWDNYGLSLTCDGDCAACTFHNIDLTNP